MIYLDNNATTMVDRRVLDKMLPYFSSKFNNPHSQLTIHNRRIVRLKEGQQISEEDIINHCQNVIAGFKCPKSISFRSQPMPVSGAGKILKTELRKSFWKDIDKKVN